MKRIILFVFLKIVEVGGFGFACYLLSLYGYWIDTFIGDSDNLISHNVGGFLFSIITGAILGIMLPVMILLILFLVGCGIYFLILKNWEWAGRIKS